MRILKLIPAIVIATALTACGDDDANEAATSATTERTEETTSTTAAELPEPAEFFEELVRMELLGQYGRTYEFIHPAQQEVISKAQYEACRREQAGPGSAELDDFEVVETYDETLTISGTDVEAEALAITWKGTLSAGNESQEVTQTSHLIDVDGEWRIFLANPSECDIDV